MGNSAEKDGRYLQAYQCYYAAGWDDFCTDDMDMILDRLSRAAEKASSAALSSLARFHRTCLSSMQ